MCDSCVARLCSGEPGPPPLFSPGGSRGFVFFVVWWGVQAYLKVLFGDSYEMGFETHPVDAVRAEASTRLILGMRLAVYNELRKRAGADGRGGSSDGRGGSTDGRGGEDAAGPISRGRVPSGRCSGDGTARGIKRMYDLASKTADYSVRYDSARIGRMLEGEYQSLDGYMRLLGTAHQLGLLQSVETAHGLVPATEAVFQGEFLFEKLKRGVSTKSAPKVVMKMEETEAYLVAHASELRGGFLPRGCPAA